MAFSSNFRQPVQYGGTTSYPGSSAPPPLPPRTYQQTAGYGMMNSGYPGFGLNYGPSYGTTYGSSYGTGYGSSYGYGGGLGYNSYGFGGMGSYGRFGSGYGGYGPNFGGITPENRFIQIAEQSARPMFTSFQSIMGMFQSITTMFDSTFHAVHASFSSVILMAENFSMLRSTFGRLFSTFSLIKTLNWLYRRLLRLLGVRSANPTFDEAWAAASAPPQGTATGEPTTTNWAAMALLVMLFTGPYLIMRLISQTSSPAQEEMWNPLTASGTKADVLYDFVSAGGPELSVRRGQIIMVAPKQFQPQSPGWVLACDRDKRIGFVPANYINIENSANLKAVIPREQSDVSLPSQELPSTFSNIIPSFDQSPNLTCGNKVERSKSSLEPVTEKIELLSPPTDVTNTLTTCAEVHIPPSDICSTSQEQLNSSLAVA